MSTIAQVQDLTIQASTKRVLDSVDLVVRRGAIVAFVGASGGGKTTLLHALVGHLGRGLRRTAGTVTVDGSDPFSLDRPALRTLRRTRVALVGQDPMSRLCPSHRVRDVIGELGPPDEREAAMARAASRAGLTDLDALWHRRAHELSGGQLRRLALARALVRDPALLLLDEPTGGLDALRARSLARELRALAANGMAIVMASHDMNHVRQVADVTVEVDRGRLAPPTARGAGHQRARRPAAPVSTVRLRAASVAALAGGRQIVSDVSFSVPAGTTLALTGPSGCGKTTLLRYLAGLTPGSGEVLLDGSPLAPRVRDRRRDERRRIQYVHQDPLGALHPARSAGDALTRPLRRHAHLDRDTATSAATDLLAAVDLPPDVLDRRPDSLSGGQRQRIALARALAAHPDILLCDEITAALDEDTSHRVLQTLRTRQQHSNLTIVWATHDRSLAESFADTILDLDPERSERDASTRPSLRCGL